MAELASLKKQRSTNKARLTNIIKFVRATDDDTTVEELKTCLARVEQLMQEFTVTENKIFLLDSNEESDYVYEENYYDAITMLNTWIRSKSMAAGNTSQEIPINASHTNHHEIKLPKINIPPFSGEYTEWQSFHDLFSSTIHESPSLSPVQKFQYLKGLLRGEAAVLLRHISVTEGNYIGALNKLKERYDRKRHIINSFVRTFIEQPSISTATATNVKQLMNTSDEVIRGLKALGDSAESRDPWLIFLLVQKLDDKSKVIWAEHVTDIENPTFLNFLDFLSRRIDTLESTNMSFKKVISNPKVKSHIATGAFHYTCAMCSETDHSLFECKQFNDMDGPKRRDWAKTSRRCYNCLSSRHQIDKCTSRRRCQHCRKKHHTLLHLIEATESIANPEIPSVNTLPVVYHCSQNISSHSIILPTALITVLDSFGNLAMCRALLDSGSQSSFITEACVHRLGLKRKNARLSVSGLGASNVHFTKGVVTITVQPTHHSELYIEALILSKITSQLPRQTLQNINLNCCTIGRSRVL